MKKNIFITGNSRGIGKYLEDGLKEKYQVFGVSKSGGVDLSKNSDLEKIANECLQEDICFNVLILNAGIGFFGSFEEGSEEEYQNIIETNLTANIVLLHKFKKLISKNTKIIFMGSIIGKKFMGGASVYQASKFGLRGFAGGLKQEGKKVHIINPKIVDTDFHNGCDRDISSFPNTSKDDILETVKNLISGEETRFEIDL